MRCLLVYMAIFSCMLHADLPLETALLSLQSSFEARHRYFNEVKTLLEDPSIRDVEKLEFLSTTLSDDYERLGLSNGKEVINSHVDNYFVVKLLVRQAILKLATGDELHALGNLYAYLHYTGKIYQIDESGIRTEKDYKNGRHFLTRKDKLKPFIPHKLIKKIETIFDVKPLSRGSNVGGLYFADSELGQTAIKKLVPICQNPNLVSGEMCTKVDAAIRHLSAMKKRYNEVLAPLVNGSLADMRDFNSLKVINIRYSYFYAAWEVEQLAIEALQPPPQPVVPPVLSAKELKKKQCVVPRDMGSCSTAAPIEAPLPVAVETPAEEPVLEINNRPIVHAPAILTRPPTASNNNNHNNEFDDWMQGIKNGSLEYKDALSGFENYLSAPAKIKKNNKGTIAFPSKNNPKQNIKVFFDPEHGSQAKKMWTGWRKLMVEGLQEGGYLLR